MRASRELLTTPREGTLAAIGARSFAVEDVDSDRLFDSRSGGIKLSLERGRRRRRFETAADASAADQGPVMARLKARQRASGSSGGRLDMGVSPVPNPTAMSRVPVPHGDDSYTIQTKGRTWQHVGRSRPFRETPITRKEILALERRYDNAMRYSRMSRLEAASKRLNPVFERDVVSARTEVEEMLQGPKQMGPHGDPMRPYGATKTLTKETCGKLL